MPDIFLNFDLCEQQTDAFHTEVMSQLHMANISCVKLQTIEKCAQLAEAQKPIAVSTGAFICPIGNEPVEQLTLTQFRALLEIQLIRYTSAADLNHIKLHSSLLQLVENDDEFSVAFLEFVRNRCLISIVCPLGSNLEKLANEVALPVTPEIMLDAHYSAEGKIIEDTIDSSLVITRLEQLHQFGSLTTDHGDTITLPEQYDHITVSLSSPLDFDQLKKVRSYLDAI